MCLCAKNGTFGSSCNDGKDFLIKCAILSMKSPNKDMNGQIISCE